MSDVVSYEVVDGVAHVTIERPEVRNAMSLAVFDQLADRAAEAAADDAVGAVLVTGRGGAFSSGLDVSVFGDQLGGGVDEGFIARLQASLTAYEDIDKPTIAGIDGYCFGGGIQLAAACHLRAVAPDAQLSVMESRWGLVPDLGGSWRLPRLVGLGRATEMTLTARRVGAEEALAIGLAELRLDGEDHRAAAHEIAARLAAEARTQLRCLTGPDFAEAVTAGLEGRAPTFTGS